MDWVDGNELAGVLGEIFAVDVTSARGACAGCGRMDTVAGARVYPHAPGLVARCPGCENVLLRVVRGGGRAWLDMRGMSFLEITMPEAAGP